MWLNLILVTPSVPVDCFKEPPNFHKISFSVYKNHWTQCQFNQLQGGTLHESTSKTGGRLLPTLQSSGLLQIYNFPSRLESAFSSTDIDECTETPDICGTGNPCTNVLGSYVCLIIDCGTGFIKNENGSCIGKSCCLYSAEFQCRSVFALKVFVAWWKIISPGDAQQYLLCTKGKNCYWQTK